MSSKWDMGVVFEAQRVLREAPVALFEAVVALREAPPAPPKDTSTCFAKRRARFSRREARIFRLLTRFSITTVPSRRDRVRFAKRVGVFFKRRGLLNQGLAGTAGGVGCPRLGHRDRIHTTFLPRRLLGVLRGRKAEKE